jgi:rhamnulokinase
MIAAHLAIDLGAGSGRAFLGRVGPGTLACEEVHRFSYAPRQAGGHLRWDATRLFAGIDTSLVRTSAAAAARGWNVGSVGVDSWGVDYGLVDAEGRLVEEPICYRDPRTDRALVDAVLARLPADELFARTGIQLMPFNTLFQLAAHVRQGLPARTVRLLMIPDLCHQRLCGSQVTEFTNATTTQLLRAGTHGWDDELFSRLELPRAIMPPIADAGSELGTLRAELQQASSLGPLRVLAPATHDTGSAVVGTPLTAGSAFISSGTWSLVGVERDSPIVHAGAARANVTNEGGGFGTVRLLKNVMGLWILESCRREWGGSVGQGFSPAGGHDYAELLADVAAVEGFAGFVYPDDLRFLNPPSDDRGGPRRADRLGPARTRRPRRARARHPRLARAALRLGARDHRAADGLSDPHHPHRRRRVAQRVPEPGDREREWENRAGGPGRSDGDREPRGAGDRVGRGRVGRRRARDAANGRPSDALRAAGG